MHCISVQPRRPQADAATAEATTTSDAPDRFDAALAALSLDEVEETAGELHRRIGSALRLLGEGRADQSEGELHARPPRWHVASLIAATELAAATFGTLAAGGSAPRTRTDQHPTTVAAIMYAAPTIPALLSRLEQDRRLLTSFARAFEARLENQADSPWGRVSFRQLLANVMVAEAARCAVLLEQASARTEV